MQANELISLINDLGLEQEFEDFVRGREGDTIEIDNESSLFPENLVCELVYRNRSHNGEYISWDVVFKVSQKNSTEPLAYFEINGYYDSWEGGDLNWLEVNKVRAVQKTITVYEAVK